MHHPLAPQQLSFAGHQAQVKSVGFYHGGDELYELKEIPGIWHEQCLRILSIDEQQQDMCAQYGTPWCPAPAHLKVGVARNVRSSMVPVNGLRHPPEKETTGWYIWAGDGDPSTDPGYFLPVHVAHLAEWRPEVMRFLGLPPGWRFLTDGKQEDIWEDPTLLNI